MEIKIKKITMADSSTVTEVMCDGTWWIPKDSILNVIKDL